MAWQFFAGAGISALGSWLGGKKSAKAASDQAKLYNEATERQLKYDKEAHQMSKDKLNADRAWFVDQNRIKARNEKKLALHKDATNAQSYIQELKIRNREQASLDAQYARSTVLYDEQIGFNNRARKTAEDSQWRELEEINAESAFDAQEMRLQNLVNEGKIRARAQGGRSTDKSYQAAMASYGQQLAAVDESLAGAGRNTLAMLEEIKNDSFSANLAAYAQKMLPPGQLPMPVLPFATPMAEFQDPRALSEYDYGPEPVKGATRSPSAASAAVWGSTISSITSSVGGAFSSYGQAKMAK